MSTRRTVALRAATALAAALVSSSAFAGPGPCGHFDFSASLSAGLDCKIEVEGGCAAKCEPFSLEAGCKGQCTAAPDPTCTGGCGEQCVATCNPGLLDCFAGCHEECDQPSISACSAQHPDMDCVSYAKAQCDNHCEEACAVPPDSCQEHCNFCCTGGCSSLTNLSCDLDCFAELKGGCDVQCSTPQGAIFCNGQYVGADDVEACIDYLLTQGIEVDVSARGSVSCDLTGCHGEGEAAAGFCSVSPSRWDVGASTLGLGIVGMAFGLAVARKARARRRKARS